MKFCIVHYNTPELTTCLCSSINKLHTDADIVIFENSDQRPFSDELFDNVTILPNSNGQLVDFTKVIEENKKFLSPSSLNAHSYGCRFGSLKHSASIQWLIENANEDFILLDSDVLLKKNINDIINPDGVSCDFLYEGSRPLRILPYLCYMNLDTINQYNLRFLDIRRFDSCHIQTDTGGTFCADMLAEKAPYKRFHMYDYIVHFGNGSWRLSNKANLPDTEQGSYMEFLMRHKELWYV